MACSYRFAIAMLAFAALPGCGMVPHPMDAGAMRPSAHADPLSVGEARDPLLAMAGRRYEVVRAVAADPDWERVECLRNLAAEFPEERMRPSGRQTDPAIVKAFGSATPESRLVLLHYAPGWRKAAGPPVVLVHGAIHEATTSWIRPHGKEGLARTLARQGRQVFAVTFAHRHGDNLLQAEQLNVAISRVREVTGAGSVDVVAHSKGTVAVRALVSDVRKPWMAPYRGDIGKLLMIGAPLLGTDYTFRHSIVNYGLYPEKDSPLANAPLSWTGMLAYGVWADTAALGFAGGFFPGQPQLLYRWDHKYPLPKGEPDWWTTYYGGQGLLSRSEGIDKAIAAGGHFIDVLRRHPVARAVKLGILAGSRADLDTAHNEDTGPSDGIVFVESATHTDDLTRGGAEVLASQTLPLNHMELIYAPAAKSWIASFLAR